jgi:tetratricopeptide (TPR) repeat protein
MNMSALYRTEGRRELRQEIEKIASFLRRDPENPRLLLCMIDLELEAGHIEDAQTWAERASTLYPQDRRIQLQLAKIYISDQRPEEAEAILKEMLESGYAPALSHLASIYLLTRRYQEAEDLHVRYAEAFLTSPQARVLRIRWLHHLGRVGEALVLARAHLAENQSDLETMGLAALLELDDGNGAEAERLANAALVGYPDNLPALVTLGMAMIGHGDTLRARTLFESAIAVKSDDGRSWLGMALVNLHSQEFDQAIDSLRRTVQYMPTHPGSWLALGWCQLIRDQIDAAEDSFGRAFALDRNFAEANGSLAVILVLKKQIDEARTRMEAALRLAPDCYSAAYAEALLNGTVTDQASMQRFATGLLRRQSRKEI